MADYSKQELASKIDHTNLKPTATYSDITKLCGEAVEHDFHAVCINPFYVDYAKALIADKQVRICSVVGFPLGMNSTSAKVAEAQEAFVRGASEIDMVMNIGAFLNNDYKYVEQEIKGIVGARDNAGRRHKNPLVKVIIETCYLSPEQIVDACKVVSNGGADYIKTSTGFGKEGATVENVKLMAATIKEIKSGLKIKAAGGIDSYEKACAMLEAGADRLGCSKSVQIVGLAKLIDAKNSVPHVSAGTDYK